MSQNKACGGGFVGLSVRTMMLRRFRLQLTNLTVVSANCWQPTELATATGLEPRLKMFQSAKGEWLANFDFPGPSHCVRNCVIKCERKSSGGVGGGQRRIVVAYRWS